MSYFDRYLIALVAAGCLGGCHRNQQATTLPAGFVDHWPQAGVWGLVARSTDAEGDARVDRHELHLMRDGNKLAGFWSRSTSYDSTDGRAFACNGKTHYESESRGALSGDFYVGGAQVHRSAILPARRHYPNCPKAAAPPAQCELRIEQQQLIASCDGQRFVFQRRLDPPVPVQLVARGIGALTGVWTWHHRSHDRQGDLKIEDEEWHLFQRNARVEGYYDRQVRVRSSDGRRFLCNNGLAYTSVARFRVRGVITAGYLHLREVGFKAKPGQCEPGRRSLDKYRGTLSQDGATLHLHWAAGMQRLRRRY